MIRGSAQSTLEIRESRDQGQSQSYSKSKACLHYMRPYLRTQTESKKPKKDPDQVLSIGSGQTRLEPRPSSYKQCDPGPVTRCFSFL